MIGKTIVEECGTTANIILIADKVYCANIGDSRSVAIIKNKPVVLSFDHKPEDRMERQRIKNAGVSFHLNS
jgi:serine/threonine protein phosphatase PrpC